MMRSDLDTTRDAFGDRRHEINRYRYRVNTFGDANRVLDLPFQLPSGTVFQEQCQREVCRTDSSALRTGCSALRLDLGIYRHVEEFLHVSEGLGYYFPVPTTNVSVANSDELSAVSAVQRI